MVILGNEGGVNPDITGSDIYDERNCFVRNFLYHKEKQQKSETFNIYWVYKITL